MNDDEKNKSIKSSFLDMMILFLSVAGSLIAVVLFVLLVITISGSYYELLHPIPVGEDDLGLGLVVVFWGLTASLVAVPLIIWLVIVFKRNIKKFINGS